MNTENNRLPMYFASLEIENIKCFGEKQRLDLRNHDDSVARWTLILGDNGVGKTTLLRSLAWMIPEEDTEPSDNDVKDSSSKSLKVKIKPFMDAFETEVEYEELVKIGNNTNSRIGATFTYGVALGHKPDDNQLVSHAFTILVDENGKFKDREVEHGELPEFSRPKLFAYGASRHMAFKNTDKTELKEHVSNLFSDSGDLYDAEQLLTVLDDASIRETDTTRATELLKKVKKILVDLLPDPEINNPDCIIINSPLNPDGTINENRVQVRMPYGNIPLLNLSLGYKTMIAWAVDLALRMLWSNPESTNPLEEPAVVIIDEIDLHLHPKWQRELRDYLTKHFTNTQFICTAHSPIMAQSAETENLCVLHKINNQVHINSNPHIVHGWRIDQILTSNLFDLPSRSNEIEKSIERRRLLMNKDERDSNEEEELGKLNEEISALPVLENSENQLLLDGIRTLHAQLKKESKIQ